MKYSSAQAFRQALSHHLERESLDSGRDPQRLQRVIDYERLLAHLRAVAPSSWVLKGGLALDVRLGDHARATQDVDIAWIGEPEAADAAFREIPNLEFGDYFAFQIERTASLDDMDTAGTVRYRVTPYLSRQRRNPFHLDVNFGEGVLSVPDELSGPDLLAFAEVPTPRILVLPLAQHVAEKVHAYTRVYRDGRTSTRVKDLIDLVLIQQHQILVASELRALLVAIFDLRSTHLLPGRLPPPPSSWVVPYRHMAANLGILADLDHGHELASAFLTPILDGSVEDTWNWNPESGCWEPAG